MEEISPFHPAAKAGRDSSRKDKGDACEICRLERSRETSAFNLKNVQIRSTISMKQYYVYITASKSRTLYIGVTNNLIRRIEEHKKKYVNGFTEKYNIDILVYYEKTNDIKIALDREKQLKKWRREKKIALIEDANPHWRDLSEDF